MFTSLCRTKAGFFGIGLLLFGTLFLGCYTMLRSPRTTSKVFPSEIRKCTACHSTIGHPIVSSKGELGGKAEITADNCVDCHTASGHPEMGSDLYRRSDHGMFPGEEIGSDLYERPGHEAILGGRCSSCHGDYPVASYYGDPFGRRSPFYRYDPFYYDDPFYRWSSFYTNSYYQGRDYYSASPWWLRPHNYYGSYYDPYYGGDGSYRETSKEEEKETPKDVRMRQWRRRSGFGMTLPAPNRGPYIIQRVTPSSEGEEKLPAGKRVQEELKEEKRSKEVRKTDSGKRKGRRRSGFGGDALNKPSRSRRSSVQKTPSSKGTSRSRPREEKRKDSDDKEKEDKRSEKRSESKRRKGMN